MGPQSQRLGHVRARAHAASTDPLHFAVHSQILKRLGLGKMKLMSAPVHFNALSGFNLEVTEFVQP
ncbi:hypothetical protein [uncultured Lentibacter sp.]|uniref:hypothetical protein n=1 Tax=uncultured Lentibacter sp. TaxID=1659309 RepID=UPI0034524A1A